MAGRYTDVDFPWKEQFRDSLPWWDNGYSKRNPACTGFKHKTTKEALSLSCWDCNAPRVPVASTRQAVQSQEMWTPLEKKSFPEARGEDPNHQILQKDTATLVALLKACARQKDLCKGSRIHHEIRKRGLPGSNVYIGAVVVTMYAKCGALPEAQQVFDELPVRDVVSWNMLIAGYAQHGQGHEALNLFQRMRHEGLSPDEVTFSCALKACGSIAAAEKGEEIHVEVVRQGLLEKNIILGNALVDMYAKCGAVAKAQEVFDELPLRDAVSWNALITGYSQHGHGHKAMDCFKQMQCQGLSPDAITFTCILKSCGSVGAIEKGEAIHAEVVRQGLLEKDTILGNSLVDMYAKCGVLAKAQEIFNELPVRDIVSWNALIAGYGQHGHYHEALNCFKWMQRKGLSPNAVTFICTLKACGCAGAAKNGEEIHAEVVRRGLLKKDIMLGTALVDMYAKCGALKKAQEVFDELPVQDVVSWSALIAGYAQLGKVQTAFNTFNRMIGKGIDPNQVTFLVLLNACSHSGLVGEGQAYFVTMSKTYGIIPSLEHHTCMVDLFGRAGHLYKAIEVIEKMTPLDSSDNLPLWYTLLGACRKWGDVKVGKLAFDRVVQVDEKNAAAYVCMSNIYAAASMPEEARKVEDMRVKNKAWKTSGCCWWTDMSGSVHSFTLGDDSQPERRSVHSKLIDIGQKISQEGYPPGFKWLLQDMSDDAKKDVLCGHTERLAIGHALINTPNGTPIHVTKNMRVCGDCHYAMSYVSRMEKRKIVIKDANCFHIFENGKCACAEYW